MCAVAVDVNPLYLLGINVAAYMPAFIDNETLFAARRRFASEYGAEKPCADYKIIVFHALKLT